MEKKYTCLLDCQMIPSVAKNSQNYMFRKIVGIYINGKSELFLEEINTQWHLENEHDSQ